MKDSDLRAPCFDLVSNMGVMRCNLLLIHGAASENANPGYWKSPACSVDVHVTSGATCPLPQPDTLDLGAVSAMYDGKFSQSEKPWRPGASTMAARPVRRT